MKNRELLENNNSISSGIEVAEPHAIALPQTQQGQSEILQLGVVSTASQANDGVLQIINNGIIPSENLRLIPHANPIGAQGSIKLHTDLIEEDELGLPFDIIAKSAVGDWGVNGANDSIAITDPVIQGAVAHLQANNITQLDLSGHSYDSSQLAPVVAELNNNSSLLSLNLSDNNIHFSNISSTCYLVHIDMSHNPLNTSSFVAFLSRCNNKPIDQSPLTFCMVEEVNVLPEKEQAATQLMTRLGNILHSSSPDSPSFSPYLTIEDRLALIKFAKNPSIRSIVKYFSEFTDRYPDFFQKLSVCVNDNLLMLKGVYKKTSSESLISTLPLDALSNITSYLSFEDIAVEDNQGLNNDPSHAIALSSLDLIGIWGCGRDCLISIKS